MIYTFRCKDCGCTWEYDIPLSKYESDYPKHCYICGYPERPKRVILPPNIIFKGDGFTKASNNDNFS